MINIFFQGRIKNKDKIVQAAEDMLYELCPKCNHDVDINIELLKEVDQQMAGYCWGDFEQIEIELARNSHDHEYTVSELLINLTHELVHAKQLINLERHDWHKHMDYRELPWEVEAYKLEESLCTKYFGKLSVDSEPTF